MKKEIKILVDKETFPYTDKKGKAKDFVRLSITLPNGTVFGLTENQYNYRAFDYLLQLFDGDK